MCELLDSSLNWHSLSSPSFSLLKEICQKVIDLVLVICLFLLEAEINITRCYLVDEVLSLDLSWRKMSKVFILHFTSWCDFDHFWGWVFLIVKSCFLSLVGAFSFHHIFDHHFDNQNQSEWPYLTTSLCVCSFVTSFNHQLVF